MSQGIKTVPVSQLQLLFKDIIKNQHSDQRIFFLLGAGASVSSGIPSGDTLAKIWLDELGNSAAIQTWLTTNGIDKSKPAQHYSKIFEKRFEHNRQGMFAYLEEKMVNKAPGFGYSVLAQILATTQHNVVITTNFDHLLEQSIYTYTRRTPLVCGHESLAGFARPTNQRPLIIKVHNDLLFSPKNDINTTSKLHENWKPTFKRLFSDNERTILVVIGYGGNDGSLMNFFEDVDTLSNLYWCLYKDEQPHGNIVELVNRHKGNFVKTEGFDALMFQLQVALDYPSLSETIINVANESKAAYDKARLDLGKMLEQSQDAELKEAQKEFTAKPDTDDWVSYELKARAAKNNDEKERIYKEGILKFPNEARLAANYAFFLHEIQKDYDTAEKLYKKTFELDLNNAINTGNYANFLYEIRKDYDAAEKLYKKALELDPDYALHTGNYANFLSDIRKDYDTAEKLYKKALELDPNNVLHTRNYAYFLFFIRKDYGAVERLYKKALKLDPNSLPTIVNYANFLCQIRKDYEAAEKLYKKALEIDPNEASNTSNYAHFLYQIRKHNDAAENLFKKALELDPNDANSNANFAQMLIGRGQKELATKHLATALNNASQEGTLLEIHFYYYANYPEHRETSLEELKRLIKEGARSPGWDFSPNIALAEKEGHPDLPLLKRLADIISNDAPADGI